MKSRLLLPFVLPALAACLVGPAGAVPPPDVTGPPMTELTIRSRSCEGCEMTLQSYRVGGRGGWSSGPETVEDGEAVFTVPTHRTVGLSISVRAPWEGHTGYVTAVVFRYGGNVAGDVVIKNRAVEASRASGCWSGTAEREVILRVKVREVQVAGIPGQVPGSIAWTPVTQPWLRPLLPVGVTDGVLGTQDVIPCKVP